MGAHDAIIRTIVAGGAAAPGEYDARGQRRTVARVGEAATRIESPRRRLLRLSREASCAAQIARLPAPDEELLMILDGRWHGFDLVAAVLTLAAGAVAHLHVATLGFNRTQTHRLAELLDGGAVRRATMLVSEVFREKDREEYELLHRTMAARGQRVAASRNHAKLILFELADGRTYAAHGSLNLRRCNATEQLALTPDPEAHSFCRAYIEEQVLQARGGSAADAPRAA